MLVQPLKNMFSYTHTLKCNTRCIKSLSTLAWSNNVYVNYLKPPRLLGPTGEEVIGDIDLTNKTCLITGGTSGIGSEIVRCLISKNCDILVACRNPYAARVLSKTSWRGDNKVKAYMTNLASFSSVRNTAEELMKEEKNIDIVIVNAAVFGLPWMLTEDGFETIFQVNYLSQLYFLLSIENILAPNARVIFMSSESHRNIKWSIEDTVSPTPNLICLPQEKYTSIKAYNTSKLCGIHAMHYLCYRWSKTSRSVFCAHPGSFIKTTLCSNWWPYEMLYTAMYPFSKSIAQAAATPLYCATSPNLQGFTDLYIKDCKECEVSALAHDRRLAFRIIDLSQSLIMDHIGYSEDLVDDTTTAEIEKRPEEISEPPKSIEEPVLSA